MEPRFDYYAKAPALMAALRSLNKTIAESGLESRLMHLVKVRASQMNGCAFCIYMHTHEARADGESEQRLYLVAAWRESPAFSERERAALAWTEAVTDISEGGVSDALYEQARAQFSDEDLVRLTAVVAMINVWNRIAIAFHAVHPPLRPEAA